MAGTLTIESNGDGGISGHSWISYTPDGGATTTYGTWGNNPRGRGNGLQENLEKGVTGEAKRTAHLDDAGEARLMQTIGEYRAKGADGWGYLSPCSAFAADSWNHATGENLAHRGLSGLSTPTTLRESMEAANAKSMTVTVRAPEPASSRSSTSGSASSSGSPIGSPVQPCADSSQ